MQVETESDRSSWFGVRELFAQPLLTILGVVLCVLITPSAVAEANAKSVLILDSFSDRSVSAAESLESAVRAQVPSPVNFYVEYLESQRFDNEAYRKSLAETLRDAYRGERLDLVIASAYPALRFSVQYREEIFPGVPIVFSGVDASRLAGQKMWPGVTGVTAGVDIPGTINLALRLHPNTDTIAVVTGTSEFESYWLAAVHTELLRHHDRVREVDFVGPPSGQLLENIASLPPNTVVLFQLAPQDSSRLAIGVYDVLAVISQRLPTYSIFPVLCLNRGCIGGVDADVEELTAATAKLAVRVFSGERPENIPIMHDSSTEIQLDWRQLRR